MSNTLINREFWVLDKKVSKCNHCQKSFNLLLRRKHHCRHCGNVFCDDCSNNFLDSSYFQLDRQEKKVRFCDNCYESINSLLEKQGIQIEPKPKKKDPNITSIKDIGSPQTFEDQKMQSQFTQQSTVCRTEEDSLNIQENSLDEQDDIKKTMQLLKDDLESTLSNIIQGRTKDFDSWYKALHAFTKQAIQDVSINTMDGSDNSMDLGSLLYIKKIPFLNYSATQYMKGMCLRKNVAHKKMQTQWKNAKVLILKGSFDKCEFTDLEFTQKSEKKILRSLIEQIDVVKPNVIFSGESVNIVILNHLEKQNITVAQNFTETQLKRISAVTGARIMKLEEFCLTDANVSLGKCDKLIFAQYDPNLIVKNQQVYDKLSEHSKAQLHEHLIKKNHKDPTYLFISNNSCKNCLQITLSGPNIADLRSIKRSLNEIVRVYYDLCMEKEQIAVDLRLKSRLLNGQKLNSVVNAMVTCGEMANFSYHRINQMGIKVSNLGAVQVSKLKFTWADHSLIHDIASRSELYTYIMENMQNFNNSKMSFFATCCEFKENNRIIFYDNLTDRSLGQEIKEKVTFFNSPCPECKQIEGKHVRVFYGPGVFVKEYTERKISIIKQDLMRENSGVVQLDSSSMNELINSTSFDQSRHPSEDVQVIEPIQQHNFKIDVHLECLEKDCKESKLTETIRLKQIHLEFSFYRLINELMVTSLSHIKDKNYTWLSNELPRNSQCNHSQIARVYTCGDICVKFYSNVFQTFTLKTFSFHEPSVKSYLIEHEQKLLEERKKHLEQIIDYSYQMFRRNMDEAFNKVRKSSTTSLKSLDETQVPKELVERLNDLTTQSKLRISKAYTCVLQLEFEVKQIFLAYEELIAKISEKVPRDSQGPLRLLQTVQQLDKTETPQQQGKQPQAKEGMLYFLINPKTIEKEMQKQSLKKQQQMLNQMKKSQQPTNVPSLTRISTLQDNPDEEKDDETLSVVLSDQAVEQAQSQIYSPYYQPVNIKLIWKNFALNHSEQLAPGIFPFIPIYNVQDVALIGYALNSKIYYDIYTQNKFTTYFMEDEKNADQKEFVRNIFQNCKDSESDITIKYSVEKSKKTIIMTTKQTGSDSRGSDTIPNPVSPMSPLEVPSEQPADIVVSPINEKENTKKNKQTAEIVLYYPKQFECVRLMNGISLDQFIRSVVSCSSWDSSGGKSGSSFYKSSDNLFIFKAVKDSEFFMFDDFAPLYFDHMFRIHYDNQPSVLNKIYGMFELRNSKGTQYFIAMENLFYDLKGELLVYDLKGSEAKRFNKKAKTLLDTNFLIDRNGEPLPVAENDFKMISQAFIFDSEFLEQCYVVDYSLLLVIDKQNSILKMGIIDYLQQYNAKKHLENRFKTVINLGFDPTIIRPNIYKDRFQKAMNRFFMGIPCAL